MATWSKAKCLIEKFQERLSRIASLSAISCQRYDGGPTFQEAMRALAAASRLSARLLSSSISAAVAASFGGGAARNSRPDEMTHVFQVPAFGSIRSPATCWASALGISSNAQSPLSRTLASETRFIAFSLVGCHARRIARGCTLRMLVALATKNVGFDSSMPADGTQHSSLHPNEISACPRLRELF